MLLLGESILSLLIVETSTSAGYYITFYAGIISVVFAPILALPFSTTPCR